MNNKKCTGKLLVSGDNGVHKNANKFIGLLGEDIACEYLKNNSWIICERNIYYKCGEIDIIALDGEVLVFIEVKTRTNNKFGGSLSAITKKKLQTLNKLSTIWINENKKYSFTSFRIDAILIDINKSLIGSINHFKGIKI